MKVVGTFHRGWYVEKITLNNKGLGSFLFPVCIHENGLFLEMLPVTHVSNSRPANQCAVVRYFKGDLLIDGQILLLQDHRSVSQLSDQMS